MSRVVRWNPVREMIALQNAMERLFEDPGWEASPEMRRWDLAVDLAETDESFLVKASLPGINPDDIDVTVEDDVLTIKGDATEEKTVEEANYHLRERRMGSFTRSLRFPAAIDPQKVEATYENGVLTLQVAKAEAVKPKKINIRKLIKG